jgi:phosphoribosylanthranilate isomerase
LTPENVVRAIDEVGPYAIDINSGVEVQPGVKDPLRLARLLGEVARLSGR